MQTLVLETILCGCLHVSSVVPSCVVCVGVVCGIILLDCAYFFVDSYVVCGGSIDCLYVLSRVFDFGIILCSLCLHFCVVCSFCCALCCICFYFLRHPLQVNCFSVSSFTLCAIFFSSFTRFFLYGSSFTWCPYSLCNVSAGVYFLSQSAEKILLLHTQKMKGKNLSSSRRYIPHAGPTTTLSPCQMITLFSLFYCS